MRFVHNRNLFLLSVCAAGLLALALARLFSGGLSLMLLDETTLARPVASRAGRILPQPERNPEPPGLRERLARLGSGPFFRSPAGTAEPEDPAGGGEITLLGVLAGSPDFARALIRTTRDSLVREYAVSERAANFRILAIHSNSILVGRKGGQRRLGLGESLGGGAGTGPASVRPVTSTKAGACRPPGCERIVADRQKLCRMAADPTKVYQYNKFTPVLANGKMEGLRLVQVQPQNNFVYELGARSGDILRRVNGQPLGNPRALLKLFDDCETVDRITADLERGGRIVSRQIILK